MAPALTISTNMDSRPSSPVPPPMSPITPTLPPAQLSSSDAADKGSRTVTAVPVPVPPAAAAAQQQPTAQQQQPAPQQQQPARSTLSHSQQSDQVGLSPPPSKPIEFESNPDVIALKSAIAVLQMQRMRATADIQALSQIKNEAVEHPDEFARDLAMGKVGRGAQPDDETTRAWVAQPIPKAQDVVRCPPINWSQYAVVGESLDKLHAEQVSRPTQGTPATIGAGGVYQFKGGDGKQEEYPGVAAPYAPLKDKIEKKTKSRK
ncbi:hypothetical protein CFAM422_000590 [Trichoderma lentiforme]|uniref:Uncharacterized protein n=1 Tax=Trichoderma lentiforme TaxID=1567552 RepID=A0A9P4XR66_9HYPO|nr:hypothetical protein CFAM422_000590 [Trichoderma lentiforme]